MRILIAEDEAIVARDIADLVEEFGHSVVGIVDMAADALDAVSDLRPDLVLLDIHLRGETDGIAVGQIMRERFQVPVIYLTAHADTETVTRAVATAPFGYLVKPFDEQVLRITIAVAHHKHQIEAQLRDSEQRFATTLRSIGDGVVVTDTAGRVTFVNARAALLIGLAPEQVMGKLLSEALILLDATTRRPIAELSAQALQISALTPPAGPVMLIGHDGQTWPVEYSATPIRDDRETPTGVVVVLHEISARVKVEAALQAANTELRSVVVALEQRTEQIAALSALGGALLRCTVIEESYAVIVEAGRRLFPDADGALYIERAHPPTVEAVACWGANTPSPMAFHPQACWVLGHGGVADAEAERVCMCTTGSPHALQDILCVPLVVDGSVREVLHLRLPRIADSVAAPAVRADRAQLAGALAEQAALGLANVQMRAALREQAIRDPLTGLFNRRYLEETLAREQRRAARSHHPIGLIMLDIDYFKQINDTWGHAAGDVVLCALSRLLMTIVRAEDIVCRAGGEEFVIVLPSASEAVTCARAELIRAQVQALHVVHDGQQLPPITISAGVAMIVDQLVEVAAALQRADDALYRAKREGRNRVVVGTTAHSDHVEYARPRR